MVSVSRGTAEASDLLELRAVVRESIEQTSQSPNVHQRRRRLKEGGTAGNGSLRGWKKTKSLGRDRELRAGLSVMYLLTIVVITSIMRGRKKKALRRRHYDQHSQERRTRACRSRLARYAVQFFVCGLLRPETRAIPHAAGHERRPDRRRRRIPYAPAPGHGNRHLRAFRRAGA